MWHLKVPKIMHCYWGTGVLPYLRYKTVETFIHLNPEWEIWFWCPKTKGPISTWKQEGNQSDYKFSCTDYLNELMNLPINMFEYDVSEYGFDTNMSEIHKSDFMRYIILASFGGVWSDMDILYFNPITELLVNNSNNKDINTFVCIAPYGHTIGFLMAGIKNEFFIKIGSLVKPFYNSNIYQSIGVSLLNRFYGKLSDINRVSTVVNIGMEAVYTYDANSQPQILNNKNPEFTKGSIGCHWYGGHRMWGDFMRDTDGGLNNLPDNIIGNLLKNDVDSRR